MIVFLNILLSYYSDWLWADYMLYDYFKERFLQKIESFGQQEMIYEKEMLRSVSEKVLNSCKKYNLDPVCEYIHKGEVNFLDVIRDAQTNKSLQILSNK